MHGYHFFLRCIGLRSVVGKSRALSSLETEAVGSGVPDTEALPGSKGILIS